MVESRDHVFTTFFSPPRFMATTRARSLASIYGPFFTDLDMLHSSFVLIADSSSLTAPFLACARSSFPCACCGGFCGPGRVCPMVSGAGHRWGRGPHHHREDGRAGS